MITEEMLKQAKYPEHQIMEAIKNVWEKEYKEI